VKALKGHILTLSEDSLNANDDIASNISPSKFNLLLLDEPVLYVDFPLGMPAWNGLTKKQKHQACIKDCGCLKVSLDVLQGVLYVVRTHC